MRLPTKPSQTPTTTGTFAMRLATVIAVSSHPNAVFSPRTISQQLHDVGRAEEVHPEHVLRTLEVEFAISFTSSVEVLVARIAPFLVILSSLPKISFFRPWSSNTASITMSASLTCLRGRRRR
jgi:hypothetical protein